MLISFEGLPGAGKSTQAALLSACLAQQGLPTVNLPDLATLDTDPVTSTLIELFTSSGDPYLRHGDAVTDTLLAAAIRTNIVATRIDPALSEHHDHVVIEDRGIHTMQSYAIASLVRDHRADMDLAVGWVQDLTVLAGQRPGQALWLRLPVDEALRRASWRDKRLPTPEHRSYLQQVDEAYAELARRDPQLTTLEAGALEPAEIHQAVHRALSKHGTDLVAADATGASCAAIPHSMGAS